ncbi:MAG: hypothetical protein EOQ49_32480, partial [Mesorhizobium sp.]
RYGAVEGALASGFATAELHHSAGHDLPAYRLADLSQLEAENSSRISLNPAGPSPLCRSAVTLRPPRSQPPSGRIVRIASGYLVFRGRRCAEPASCWPVRARR